MPADLVRIVVAIGLLALTWPSAAHSIYTGVKGKDGQLCCGGNDCFATVYRERSGGFEFFSKEEEWIRVPSERITFLPVPGDEDNSTPHHAHLCYRHKIDSDASSALAGEIVGDWVIYCAFIPPGGV